MIEVGDLVYVDAYDAIGLGIVTALGPPLLGLPQCRVVLLRALDWDTVGDLYGPEETSLALKRFTLLFPELKGKQHG